MHKRKKYMINEEATVELLLENNFIEGGIIREISKPKYHYQKKLVDNIVLNIEIGVNDAGKLDYDDGNHILIIDYDKHKPYYPLYFNKDDENLDKVISELNKTMDELVEKGIFKERNLKKDKINKLSYKKSR